MTDVDASSAPGDLVLDLASDGPAARTARLALEGWLSERGLDAMDVLSLVHATLELVLNAVEHAPPNDGIAVEIQLHAHVAPSGEVIVDVVDGGRWRTPVYDVGRGRGLAMAAGLTHDLKVTTGEDGTHARLRYRPAVAVVCADTRALSHVEVRERGPRRLVLSGVLTNDDVELLSRAVERTSAAGDGTVVIDLSGVTALAPLVLDLLAVLVGEPSVPEGARVRLHVEAASVPHVECIRAAIACVVQDS